MKRIMLSVLGLSPQVLTEALYALFMQGRLVDEIHVITTITGRDLVHSGLLASGEGAFFRFLDEYEIPVDRVHFPPGNIHVLRNEIGEELSDIVTPEDNEILIMKCMDMAWRLTNHPDQAVYFMIAGGRKTMSACLALAAQFYGRPNDRIYHVLVSPEFESCRDFYFPPRRHRLIATRDSLGKTCFRNTKDAKVWLVSMPFVSVRDRLSKEDLCMPKRPQILLSSMIKDSPAKLTIDLENSFIVYKGRQIDLPPLMTALLAFFAVKKKQCPCAGRDQCAQCFLGMDDIVENIENQRLIRDLYEKTRNKDVYSMTLTGGGITRLDASNFATYRSKLNSRLEKEFGCNAEAIKISSIGPKSAKRYGIDINPQWIELKEVT